ncbi:ATP-binding cassette domain-containing protein [Arthrobacter wenxiniae]|uniref:ATP-binding cassette domain-containing protein n=1 Tax=Arthrobacter wenxiniae TaxID=2713570 RepID=A0A7Y7IGN8_9MICC|nr:ATP-binding cassette domain-containing protein [Arthrobacter wenxiniae]
MEEPAPPPILVVDKLKVAYGARTAVAGVSFDIRPGEIFGLLGPNGAGKTSTLSAIEGLVRPSPDACWWTGSTPWNSRWKSRPAWGCNCSPQASRPNWA